MRLIRTLFLTVAFMGLLPLTARAANAITFDNGMPSSPAAGKVNGTGSYTLVCGSANTGVLLVAKMTGGGTGGQIACMINMNTKTWSGTITGLPAGTYDVSARMTIRDACFQITFVDTATVKVTVK